LPDYTEKMTLRRAPRRVAGAPPAVSRVADPEEARTAAVALLARRDFASKELHERLAARGFEAPAVEAALASLGAEGTLNDARYAENYVTCQAGRGRGPVRIAAELRMRGLAAELIEAALAVPDWRAAAGAARTRRFGEAAPADWRERVRQARFLQYRGFSADHIRAATGADPDTD
jgi:regulatory protein